MLRKVFTNTLDSRLGWTLDELGYSKYGTTLHHHTDGNTRGLVLL